MKWRRVLIVASLAALFGASALSSPAPRGSVLGASTGTGGVVLDGFGGLHLFGSAAVDTAGAPYWGGWDIARAVAVAADGSGGWTLDGFGGIHAWGAVGGLQSSAYWPGWDIARALYVMPGGSGGYVLDGFGGIHQVGNAPALSGYAYWPGWDVARGLDIHLSGAGVPDGGWMLDGYGGVHPFGAAPALPSGHYVPGYDVFQRIHVVSGGAYEVTRYGDVEQLGSPAGISWAGYPSWGSWDIARDVVPVNASLSPGAVPIDRGIGAGLMNSFQSIDRQQRGRAGLAAYSTLSAIAGEGAGYNEASCGGPAQMLSDRTADMYSRNYFAHAIAGCSGTQYVFSTYLAAYRVSYHNAGENIAWREGDGSLIDDVAAINQMWLNSPDHYANIMGSYGSVGCGVYYAASGSYQGASGSTFVWACEFRG